MQKKFSEDFVTKVVIETIEEIRNKQNLVPTGISVRHIHIERKHLDKLYGYNYELTKKKYLSQKGQYAAEETLDLIGPKGTIKNVRILGPLRKQTQVEVSLSDARVLGIKPPLRKSGDLKNSLGIKLKGPKGEIDIDEGVIVADRHIHMSIEDSKKFNVKNGDLVKVYVESEKSGVFDNVSVRVDESFTLDFHIDTDDANAFFMEQGHLVKILKK